MSETLMDVAAAAECEALSRLCADAAGRMLGSAASEAEAVCCAAIAIRKVRGMDVSGQSDARRCAARTREMGGHRWIAAGWHKDGEAGWCDALTCAVCPAVMLFEVSSSTREYIERREAEGWADLDADSAPQADAPVVIEQMPVPSREEIETWGEGAWVRLWLPPYAPANPDGVVYEFRGASYGR